MKNFLTIYIIPVLICIFVYIACFMLMLRFYPINIGIQNNDLSNMYQIIITILTILLGFSSIVNFYYSKITAENTMHDLVKNNIKKTVKEVLSDNNNHVKGAISDIAYDLQKQINDLKIDIDNIQNKIDTES